MKRKWIQIINGMFYGDAYTKGMLWSVFMVTVLFVGSILTGLALMAAWAYVAAVLLAVADGVLLYHIKLDVATVGEEDEPEAAAESKEERVAQTANETEKSESEPIYTQREMKQMFYKYKVKKNHRPVLIDSSERYHIHECPAYAWTHRGALYLLLLEKEPRTIALPLSAVNRIYYEKNVPADQRREYDCLMGAGLVPMVFGEYRPVYHSVVRKSRQQEVKNLYVLDPDIKFTPASARELFTLLQPEFVLRDEVMESQEYNQYFKQLYRLKVLLDDGVVNMKDYQGRVRGILQRLTEAALTPAAVRMTLADMVRYGLISNEYATYYSQYNRQHRRRERS